MRLEEMILVSVDDHVVEPPDLFEGRLSAKHADVAPKLVRKDSGIDVWQFMGAELPNIGLNAVAGRPPEEYAMDPQSFDDMRTGCYDIHDRVKDMNANGVLGSMCFPSLPAVLRSALRTRRAEGRAARDRARAAPTTTGTSRAGAARIPGRFIPLAIPMMWDVDKMAAEVRRVADKGCFAVTFSENPVHLGHPSIHSGHWDKFFATCEELGTVVNVHIGSSSKMVITADDAPMDVLITLSPINIVQAAADFVWSKVPHEVPEAEVRAQRGRHRLDSLLPRAHRLHVRPPPLLDRHGPRRPHAEPDHGRAGHLLLDRRPGRRRHAAQDEHRHDLLGVRLPALRLELAAVARGGSGSRCRRRTAPTRTSTRSRTPTRCASTSSTRSRRSAAENCTVGALRAQAEGWDVSIVARGIKATGTGAIDLLNFAKADR